MAFSQVRYTELGSFTNIYSYAKFLHYGDASSSGVSPADASSSSPSTSTEAQVLRWHLLIGTQKQVFIIGPDTASQAVPLRLAELPGTAYVVPDVIEARRAVIQCAC